MKIKVMKFGGTSVATPEARIASAHRVIAAKESGYTPVVVVSAIGRKGAPYATDTLIGLLKEIDTKVEPEARELDMMMACGEILSSVIFAHTLKTLGHKAQAFRGDQAGIKTDLVFNDARISSIDPAAIFRSLELGFIPVICGFQGAHMESGTPSGELTTLGRGGSDTTASAIGAALKATVVEIYTDVDGVKTADPSVVGQAKTLQKVTYEEVAEIAHLGAKVVHPRAVEIAMKYNLPLWVKNTFSDEVGTEILHVNPAFRELTGITQTGKLVYLSFDLKSVGEQDREAIRSHLFQILARNSFNLFVVSVSQVHLGFAVPRDQYLGLRDLIDSLVVPRQDEAQGVYLFQVGPPSKSVNTQAELLHTQGEIIKVLADVTEGCTMVSVVGREFVIRSGVFYRILKALDDNEIPVLQTTDSNFSIGCLIPEAESKRAIRVLHENLQLESLT